MKIGGILKIKKPSYKKAPFRAIKKRLRNRKAIAYFFGFLALFTVLTVLWVSKDLPTPSKLAKLHATESTKIMDRNGGVLYQTGEERRTVVEFDKIPDYAKQATLAAEDANFYKHGGVDFRGIARAAFKDILNMSAAEGGSTITQQFVKNALLTNQKTFSRKFRELILALEIEQIYSKDEILGLYLNEIPYGGNIYGIEEASRQFFNKSANELTLSEAATVAAVPRAPTYYSPWGTHTDSLFARKNYILDRMSELGYISKEDAEKAKQEGPTKENLTFQKKRESIKSPHFVMYVKERLVDLYGERLVNSGGLKVTTTLDGEKQRAAEEAIAKNEAKFTRYGATNAALVSTDVKTGEILAMIGGKDYFDIEHGGNVNVTDSARQPGSSFKPIVYATAFKQQRFSPSFTIYDVATDFNGYQPKNYDGSSHGALSIRQSLANSLNIPAVKTLALVGVNEALKTAKDLGITTLNEPERYGLALTLGGGEVKPIEMAGAFGAFANSGVYHQPVSILKIEDSQGKVLYEYKEESNRSQAIDPQIAYQISDILDDDGARSMIFGFNNALNFGKYHVAAKTGTTNEFHDAWTVGYSPKIATAVWVGNNDNAKMKNGADGSVVAAPIFHSYMEKFLDDSEFARPDGIKELTVEKYSNKLPTQYSKTTVKDIFASWQIPTEKDDINVMLRVNRINGKLATDNTPAELIEERLFTNIHNEWGNDWKKYPNWEGPVRSWAQANGFNLTAPDEKDDSYNGRPTVEITSPSEGSQVSGEFDVSVSANSDQGIEKIVYYIDNAEATSSSSSPYSVTLESTKYSNGSHTLTARMTDKNGIVVEDTTAISIKNSTPPQISSIQVSYPSSTNAIIKFATDQSSSAKVDYGTTTAYGSTKSSSSTTTSHQISIGSLTAGVKYYFKITATNEAGSSTQTGSFTAS
ncbi:MAG: Penicillin-binding protein 1F [candidate division WS2 bacterium ADurb.Bin280]|uniref:Penicillin-binding protein 1F n=1 Tax=candidate division WS2 bacterium ADurb.Bin280 TaxID=1852829 RepID=A0A1V5SF50_9BACT|nr:MAG: Penicillin-binding protein 1F [candidate division WS2 bacterium ADurb.Bin280]